MARGGRLLRLLPLLAVLLAPAAASAQAAPCVAGGDRGFGGTGHEEELRGSTEARRSEEKGFGGTGAAEDRGFGGTGLLAGRGVFGTVTGFGSLCVNGLRIEYDGDTPVDRDGEPTASDTLRRGQTVLVDAHESDGRILARRISVSPSITGPVTSLDAPGGRLEVMGQPVEVPAASAGALPLDTLRLGDRVSVHGLPMASGRMRATRIEPAAPGQPASVVGRARRSATGGVAIGGTPVSGVDVAPAATVRVGGRWDVQRQVLAADRVGPALRFAEGTRLASVEVRVDARIDSRLETSLVTVDASRIAEALGGVRPDTRLWVEGRLDAAGLLLRADRITIEPIGGGLPAPGGVREAEPLRELGEIPAGRAGREGNEEEEGAEEREREEEDDFGLESEDDEFEREEEDDFGLESEDDELDEADHDAEKSWRFDPNDFLEDADDFFDRSDRERDEDRDDLEGSGVEREGREHEEEGPESEFEESEFEGPEFEEPEFEEPEFEEPEFEEPEFEEPELP